MKVLIVEDDPDQLAVRGMLFAQRGFAVLPAMDGKTALRLAREQEPRCAVVDLRMPSEELGLELITNLKNLPHAPELIVFTGLLGSRTRENPVLAGLVCLEKGTSSAKLLQAVEQACAVRSW